MTLKEIVKNTKMVDKSFLDTEIFQISTIPGGINIRFKPKERGKYFDLKMFKPKLTLSSSDDS